MKNRLKGVASLLATLYLCIAHAQNSKVEHLLEATKKGDLNIIKQHVDMLPAVEQKHGCTLLHEAASLGHLSIIKFLVAHDKEALNKKTTTQQDRYTPLFYAISRGHYEATVFLCCSGADVTIRCGKFGLTPFHVAVESGHLDIMTFLMTQHKADVNALSTSGETPLFIACQNNLPDVVQFLIYHNADVNKTESGWTPFHIAIQNNHEEVIKILMASKELDVHRVSRQKTTPLYLACHCGKIKLVEKLLARGAAVNQPRVEGLTPLHAAAGNGHVAIVRLLLEHGADPTLRDQKQRAPAYYATCDTPVSIEHQEIAELLAKAQKCRKKRSNTRRQKRQHKRRRRQKRTQPEQSRNNQHPQKNPGEPHLLCSQSPSFASSQTEVFAQSQLPSQHANFEALAESSLPSLLHTDTEYPERRQEPQNSQKTPVCHDRSPSPGSLYSSETHIPLALLQEEVSEAPTSSPHNGREQTQTLLKSQMSPSAVGFPQLPAGMDHTSILPILAQIMACSCSPKTDVASDNGPRTEEATESFLTLP